jgi:AcrR family transcriptional regulator
MREDAPNGGAAGDRLPRGRHQLSRDEVLSSQRRRMLDAMTVAVARSGYADTTVADVIDVAGVSRRTFYEHFRDKQACYLAAFAESAMDVLQQVALRTAAADHWLERAREGLRAYLGHLAAHPDASVAFIAEVAGAGSEAFAQRDRIHAQFAEFLRAVRDEAAEELPLPPLPDEAYVLIVGGLEYVVAREIRAGRARRLPALEDHLLYVALSMFAGHRAAAAAVPELGTPAR